MKELFINTEDDIRLGINHYQSCVRDTVIIICPGCFICKDARPFLEMSEEFFKFYDVITMDFRGHGRSSGLFTFTALEYKDLQAVVEFAKQSYARVKILAFSLGAATAIIYCAKYKDVDGLIAVSAPADFDKIENQFLRRDNVVSSFYKFEFGKTFNIRPGNLLLKKIKPEQVIGQVAPIPVMLIAGRKDTIVFPGHSEQLFQEAGEPKFLKIFDEAAHAEDVYLQSKDGFVNLCVEWLTR